MFDWFTLALSDTVHAAIVRYPQDRSLSLEDCATLVRERLPPGPLVLLAESFSGLVVLTLLPQIAKRVRGVVFCAAFARPPRPYLLRLAPFVPGIGRVLRASSGLFLRHALLGTDASDEKVQSLQTAIRSVRPDVLSHRVGTVARPVELPSRTWEIPCLYLQAKGDRLVPAASSKWFERHFRPFDLRTIDGPHLLLQTRAAECARHIHDFVGRLR